MLALLKRLLSRFTRDRMPPPPPSWAKPVRPLHDRGFEPELTEPWRYVDQAQQRAASLRLGSLP